MKSDTGEQPHPPRSHRCHSIRKIVLRTVRVMAVVLLLLVLYVLWFMAGRPEPTTDYIAMLNEITRPDGLTAENNAWPQYERAIQQYVPRPLGLFAAGFSMGRTPWFDDLNEREQEAIRQWIADNEAAWQSFVQAADKPYCWRQYQQFQGPVADILDVPTLQRDRHLVVPLRRLTFLGAYRIRSAAHAGRTRAALQDCLTLVRAGVQWSRTGSLLDSLLALGMAKTGHQEFLKVLARAPTDEVDWQELQVDLSVTYCPDPFEIRMDLEKLTALDIVQHIFTRGGIGGGHLIPRFVWPWVRMHSIVITMGSLPEEPGWRQRGLHLAMALTHARRNATVAECHARYELIKRILAVSPYELSRSKMLIVNEHPDVLNNTVHFDSFLGDTRYFTVELSAPVARETAERQWQLQAQHEAAETVVALKRWQSEHGQFPDNLEQLVRAGFLESPPLDPYSDAALVYRRTDNRFTLYSRGRNLKDDGGASLIDPNDPRKTWGTDEGGDAVFWPVQ